MGRAEYRCQRCGKGKELQVHHLTYERLGEELPTDLEVVCRSCHEEHHFEESRTNHLGVFVELVSEALGSKETDTIADLSDLVKSRCVALKIKYRADQIDRAIALVMARQKHERPPERHWAQPATNGVEIGRAEAESIVRRLGLLVPLRSMPSVQVVDLIMVDKAKALRMLSAEILESIARCEAFEHEPV